MKIEILNEEMEEKTIRPKNGNEPFTLYEQYGRIQLNDEIRKLTLTNNAYQPYKKGVYQVDPKSYYVDQFGSLKMGKLILKPVS